MADSVTDRRIEWPDFLRGASALAIVLFHVRVTMWVGLRALQANPGYTWFDRASAWVTLPFPFFGEAVMLFFVVSGFAIHYPYAQPGVRWTLRPYAARRFFRIYPPYLAVVLLTIVAEYVAARLAHEPSSSHTTTAATVAMVQNYLVPARQMTANPSLWSLPVEVELYLVYPILLWFWRRVGTTCMLMSVALISMTAAGVLLAGHPWVMGNFAKYWIIWVSGAVLAERARTHTLPVWHAWYGYVALASTVAAIAAREAGVPPGIEHFIWGVVYFVLLLWGLSRPSVLAAVPRGVRRTVLFLGDISYSLYLVHYPLLVVIGAAWIAMAGHKPINVIWPLLASLVPIPFAYVLWRLIERPSQALGRALARPAQRDRDRAVTSGSAP
jgi:peptidoglycan/LPS O-acetylase OafA/YrhL